MSRPLAPAAFWILVSLRDRDRHGYDILKQVASMSSDSVRLGPGTLYTNLSRMLDGGIITEVPSRVSGDDPRRRYYRLTASGRKALAAELERMERAIKLARTPRTRTAQ